MKTFNGLALAASLLATTPAFAETRTVELTLERALGLALQNNLGLKQEELRPAFAETGLMSAEAVWDPVLAARLEYDRNRLPLRITTGPDDSELWIGDVAVSQKLPWGTEYRLAYGWDWLDLREPLAAQATHGALLNLSLRQPLLKGAWGIPERTAVENAERGRRIADADVRRATDDVLLATAQAYWRLVRAREGLGVARESLALAETLLERAKVEVEAGTLEPVEVTQAKAGVALRRDAVIAAEAEVGNAEDALERALLFDPKDPFGVELVPLADAEASLEKVALEPHLEIARKQRPELEALGLARESQRGNVKVARNALLPQVDLVGSAGVGGLDPSWSATNSQLGSELDSQYRWSAGVLVSFPIGNHAARSQRDAAELSLKQLELATQDLEVQIDQEVRSAVRAVNSSYERVEASRVAVQLAEEQLRAEQLRLEAGLSTTFEVLRLQNDLVAAREQLIRAGTDYQTSRLALERADGTIAQRYAGQG